MDYLCIGIKMKYSESYSTGKIKNVYYGSSNKTDIEVEWFDEESGHAWVDTIDVGSSLHNSLLEEYPEEVIMTNSTVYWKSRQLAFETQILEYIKNNPEYCNGLVSGEIAPQVVAYCLMDNVVEELFKIKLCAFDHDTIKNNKDKAKKAELRRAKTFEDLVSAIVKFKT